METTASRSLSIGVPAAGNIGFLLELDFGRENRCQILFTGSGQTDGTDHISYALIGNGRDGSATAMVSMGASDSHVHIGGVDTAGIIQTRGGNRSGQVVLDADRSGRWTYAVAGRNLAFHPDSVVPEPLNQTLYLEFQCAKNLTLEDLRTSVDVVFFAQQAARGGTGAHVGVPPRGDLFLPFRPDPFVASLADRAVLENPRGAATLAFLMPPGQGELRLTQSGNQKARWVPDLDYSAPHQAKLDQGLYHLEFNGVFQGGTRGFMTRFDSGAPPEIRVRLTS